MTSSKVDHNDTKVPIAALSMSQRSINDCHKLYPDFPLHKIYNIILIDPPWKYGGDKYKPPYPCLTFEELKKLPLRYILSEDGFLFVWITTPMKAQGIKLIEFNACKYEQTQFVWVKQNKDGNLILLDGKYSKTSTEELLIGVRGNVTRFLQDNKKTLPNQVQFYPVTRHSEKPRQFQQQLSRVLKLDKMECLEIFARHRTLPNFDLYGDQINPRYQPAINIRQTIQQLILDSSQLEQRTQNIMDFYIQSLPESQQKQQQGSDIYLRLKRLIQMRIQAFAFSKSELGLTDILQHRIDLTKDAEPVRSMPYTYAPKEQDFIKTEIELLMNLGCIEHSISEWASPIVLVRKQNGEIRMCIDYRGLNKRTQRDPYPLPRIDHILRTVCKGKHFTRIDLKSGFWQISMYFKDRYKTSFVCHLGTFQWKRMPMGLTNAPATFQRIMNMIFGDILDFCMVYLDDVVIFSQTVDEHLDHISIILQRLQEANLKIGPDKCSFLQESIELLGHKVSHQMYEPLQSRVEAIQKIAPPKDVKHIQIFLGLVNYHGQFIKDFAKTAKPLRDLTKKGVPFEWKEQQQIAFEQLKNKIAEKPILSMPVPDKIMILYTDFSIVGLGAVLAQETEPGQEQVIEYASRTLKKHENNYPAYKGEILAVSWAVHKFRYFLLQAPFKLILDNEAAVSFLKKYKTPENINNLQRTVLNWILELTDFTFMPIHRAGKTHQNADALSRLPQIQDSMEQICNVLINLTNYDYIPIQRNIQPNAQHTQLSIVANIIGTMPQIYVPQIYSLNLNWFGAQANLCCLVCNSTDFQSDNNDMLICDYCSKAIHQQCHNPKVMTPPLEPWYCYECYTMAKQKLPEVDITLNFDLIQYLKNQTIPDSYSSNEKGQLKELAEPYYYETYRIRVQRSKTLVPTVNERRLLLNFIHESDGHMKFESLYNKVITEYYWPTIRSDIIRFLTNCEHCSYINPKFIDRPYLQPTQKGDRPFSILHMDLTGDLQTTKTTNGNRYILLIIDTFSKWIEIYCIHNKTAETVSACFFDFIKRFGCPQQVITDKGTEFKSVFTQLLYNMRIEFITIAPRNPQANGQVEIYVKICKRILRRYMTTPKQNMQWDEACPMIQLSMNTTPSATTKYSPYYVVFGREANFPNSVIVDPILTLPQEPSDQQITKYVSDLKAVIKTLHPKITQNIIIADERNKKYYDQRHSKSQQDFSKGDQVLVKIPRPTKLGPIGKGPFEFHKYNNKDKTSAILIDPTNTYTAKENGKQFLCCKTFTESTANLAKVLINRQNYEIQDIENY